MRLVFFYNYKTELFQVHAILLFAGSFFMLYPPKYVGFLNHQSFLKSTVGVDWHGQACPCSPG